MKPIPYYVLALAIAIPAMLVGVEIPSMLTLCHQTLAWHSDLRVFYTPGYMLRSGQRKDIYNFPVFSRNEDERVAPDEGAQPFLHPAYEAVIFMPLSLLPYRAAYLAWTVVNFAILGSIYLLLRPLLSELSKIGPPWAPAALLLGFMPVAFSILEAQDSLFLLLILVLAYRRLESDELQAGMLLGLAMFRFQVLLPIVALFLVWRSFKFVAGWAAVSAAVVSVSTAITGVAAQIQYITLLRQMGRFTSVWLLLRRMPNLRALFEACGFGIIPLALACLLIFAVAALAGARQNGQQRLLLAISVSALVPYYLFFHDLSVLALPLLLAINEATGRRDWLRAAMITAALSGFAAFWFTQGKLYLGVIFTLLFFITQVAGKWMRRPGIPLLSHSS